MYVSGRENSPQYAHTYSSLLGMRRWVHITPYQGDPEAECLGWTTYHSSNVPTNRLLPTAQYYTQDSRLRKHIAYSNVKVLWETKLPHLCFLTRHTCPLMSAFLQGNEYLHTCYCSCHNQLTGCVCPQSRMIGMRRKKGKQNINCSTQRLIGGTSNAQGIHREYDYYLMNTLITFNTDQYVPSVPPSPFLLPSLTRSLYLW